MIQDFALNIKTAFHSQNFSFFNEPVFSQIEKIEHHCLNNMKSSSLHTHNGVSCKSSKLVFSRSYSRHYVSFHHDICDDMLTVPVFYCENDRHYHALLPNMIIVPYSSFSIFFILRVLSMKYFSSVTVEKITELFHISVSTLYRWIKKYNAYLKIFSFLKNKYHMHFFIHLIYDFCDLIHDIFDLVLHTLFQNDYKLFNLTP